MPLPLGSCQMYNLRYRIRENVLPTLGVIGINLVLLKGYPHDNINLQTTTYSDNH
jgi:hypothetical protein